MTFDGFDEVVVYNVPYTREDLHIPRVTVASYPVLIEFLIQLLQQLVGIILCTQTIPRGIAKPENACCMIKILERLTQLAKTGAERTLTCPKSFQALGLIYAFSGTLGMGPLSLRRRFLRGTVLGPFLERAGLMMFGITSGVSPFWRLLGSSSGIDFLFPVRALNFPVDLAADIARSDSMTRKRKMMMMAGGDVSVWIKITCNSSYCEAMAGVNSRSRSIFVAPMCCPYKTSAVGRLK